MRMLLAFRIFFIVLFKRETALRVRELIDAGPSPVPDETRAKSTKSQTSPASQPTRRSDALNLLSALQREARMLDLVCESIDDYNDAQIGAAARDVIRDTRKSLDRMFGLKHLIDSAEGEPIEIPDDASPARWRMVGKSSGQQGLLSHSGWQATKLDLPKWSGNPEDSLVIAAAEVET